MSKLQKLNFQDIDFQDKSLKLIKNWVDLCFEEFKASEYFHNLTEIEQENSAFWVRVFFDYSYSYHLLTPSQLNKEIIRDVMLYILPRKVSADKETFECFSNIFCAFLTWGSDYFNNSTKSLCKEVQSLADEMLANSQNSDNWGMAKSFMFGQFPKFDMDNYSEDFVAHKLGIETFKRAQPKIGRNDPCNCGSGKKHKKCCGGS